MLLLPRFWLFLLYDSENFSMASVMGQSYVVILVALHLDLYRISPQHRYTVKTSVPLFSSFFLDLFSKWSIYFLLMMRCPVLKMHLLFLPLYKRYDHVDLTCHHPHLIIILLRFCCCDRPLQTYLHFGKSRLLLHQSTCWHFYSCYYLLMSEHWTYFCSKYFVQGNQTRSLKNRRADGGISSFVYVLRIIHNDYSHLGHWEKNFITMILIFQLRLVGSLENWKIRSPRFSSETHLLC